MKLLCMLLPALLVVTDGAMLYPKASETREVLSLDGMWSFAYDFEEQGYQQKWHKTRLETLVDSTYMPVPSSYNDISTKAKFRDHIGAVWYERTFYVPKSWSALRVMVRFGSVSNYADVWVNGKAAITHNIGHLPFEADITTLLTFGTANKITVSCDNTLTNTTIPQGEVVQIETDDGIKKDQLYSFDFFNYAGIHRPVLLYTTHKTNYIKEVDIQTDVLDDQKTGALSYQIDINNSSSLVLKLTIYDDKKNIVSQISPAEAEGIITIDDVNLWWPYLMDKKPGYLYNLEIQLLSGSTIQDVYNLPFGIRKLFWNEDSFLINNKNVYLTGFGKHEDSDIRGRGVDLPTIAKDFNLIEWLGGNTFRTSHYPYAEEIMDMADRLGIMVIVECPAVNIENFSQELQDNHKQSINKMINRDKNRPSVIAWSIANEPRSNLPGAENYFKDVAEYAKSLDITRPITASIDRIYNEDKLAQFLDIISFNRYNGWYTNEGRLDMIITNLLTEADNWRQTFNKPILISEYGADTMEGLHLLPDYIWSEEYQLGLLSNHFKAFDNLRSNTWFIGEFIWNFADFKTAQKTIRVGGNKKGLFTRNRQPKAAAHHVRKRYFQLANELYNAAIPNDLQPYVHTIANRKNEL